MASEEEISAELNTALNALGHNLTREQIQATCVEVLTRHMLKPEVDLLSVDPDGTIHYTIKWASSDRQVDAGTP